MDHKKIQEENEIEAAEERENNSESETAYLDSKLGAFNKDPSVTTIYVGNLSYEKTEIQIAQLFERFGNVSYVKIVKDTESKTSKGIAFVQMANRKHALKAIDQLDSSELDERKIKVSIAQENEKDRVPAPPRKRRKPYKAYVAKKDRLAQSDKDPKE